MQYLLCAGVHRRAARRGGGSSSENKGKFGCSTSFLKGLRSNADSLKAGKYAASSFMEHNSRGCLAMGFSHSGKSFEA